MKNLKYILLLLVVFCFCGCEEHETKPAKDDSKNILVYLTRATTTDEDNLLAETTINNLSIFLTEPASNTVSYKYINHSFTTTTDGCKLVSLPLQPEEAQSKDIYVVANYNDETALNNVTTIEQLESLQSPLADAAAILTAENGLCMYGTTLNHDFTTTTGNQASVDLVRLSAKIKITVSFPNEDYTSSDNSFIMDNVAGYTYLVKDLGEALQPEDYFTYTTAVVMNANTSGNDSGITYVYESEQEPTVQLHMYLDNSPEVQIFEAVLPLPKRNYMYSITFQVFKTSSATRGSKQKYAPTSYGYKSIINVYDDKGNLITKLL